MTAVISPHFHKYSMGTDNIEFIKTTSSKLERVANDYPCSFIHTHDVNDNDTTDDRLYIGDEMITDRLNVGNVNLDNPTRKVGGLEAMTVGQLNQKSISQIILEMVKPDVVPPTPSSRASISISYSGDRLIEVGSNLPESTSIITSVNKGEWSDGTSYAGEPGEPEVSISSNDWGIPADETTYTISGSVTFAEGGIPKDNFDTPYPNLKYPGGTVNSNTITIKVVKPIYINGYKTRTGDDGDTITDMRKYLIDYNEDTSIEITIPAETYSERFEIYVPYELSKLELYKYDPTRSDLGNSNPQNWTIAYNTRATALKFIDDEIPDYPGYYKYIRDPEIDNSYNTAPTLYKINLKK